MPDQEFYRSPEHWPQPAEEACTLENTPEATIPREPKKKKKSARQRKKLSESLAGVTVAALTVVMVATAIPDMKDAFGGIQDDFQGILGGSGEICPVCGQDCPYYNNGLPGLEIALDDRPEYLGVSNLDAMAGFTYDDREYDEFTGAVMTESGQRLVLRVSNELWNNFSFRNGTDYWGNSDMEFWPEGRVHTGIFSNVEDEDIPGSDRFVYVGLVYDPTGAMPMPDTELLQSWKEDYDFESKEIHIRTRYIPVDGQEHAHILLMTDLDSVDMEELAKSVRVETVEETGLTFDLGSTMVFTETDEVLRNYNDGDTAGIRNSFDFNTDAGPVRYALNQSFWRKEYSISVGNQDREILFAAVSWHRILDQWQELNENAAATGHNVAFPLVRLEKITANGITYQVYAYYTAVPVDDMNDTHRVQFYYVPEQEPAVAIHSRWNITSEELNRMLEGGRVPERYREEIQVLLNQITLSDETNTWDAALCAFCGQEACAFFERGDYFVKISQEGDPSHPDGDDLFAMPGFCSDDLTYDAFADVIFTESGMRLALRAHEDIYEGYVGYAHTGSNGWIKVDYDYTEIAYYFQDAQDRGDQMFLYAKLVYCPAGAAMPEPNLDETTLSFYPAEDAQLQYRTVPVPGVDNARLLIVSDLPAAVVDEKLQYFEVTVIEDTYRSYDLGTGLVFTDSDRAYRGYEDAETEYLNRGSGGAAHGDYSWLYLDYDQKRYSIAVDDDRESCHIVFTPEGWNAIFSRWQDMEDLAQHTGGHTPAYQATRLNDVTVNGIHYQCYMVHSTSWIYGHDGDVFGEFYYIPEQQPDMAVVIQNAMTQEEFKEALDSGVHSDNQMETQILNQITRK